MKLDAVNGGEMPGLLLQTKDNIQGQH